MPQNSVIFGALFVGFLVYITTRGELPKYAAIFTASKASPASPLASPGPPSNPTGQSLADPNQLLPGTLGKAGVTQGQSQQMTQTYWNYLRHLFGY